MLFFWNQVFITVNWSSAQNCKNSLATSFRSSKPCFPHHFLPLLLIQLQNTHPGIEISQHYQHITRGNSAVTSILRTQETKCFKLVWLWLLWDDSRLCWRWLISSAPACVDGSKAMSLCGTRTPTPLLLMETTLLAPICLQRTGEMLARKGEMSVVPHTVKILLWCVVHTKCGVKFLLQQSL